MEWIKNLSTIARSVGNGSLSMTAAHVWIIQTSTLFVGGGAFKVFTIPLFPLAMPFWTRLQWGTVIAVTCHAFHSRARTWRIGLL